MQLMCERSYANKKTRGLRVRTLCIYEVCEVKNKASIDKFDDLKFCEGSI